MHPDHRARVRRLRATAEKTLAPVLSILRLAQAAPQQIKRDQRQHEPPTERVPAARRRAVIGGASGGHAGAHEGISAATSTRSSAASTSALSGPPSTPPRLAHGASPCTPTSLG